MVGDNFGQITSLLVICQITSYLLTSPAFSIVKLFDKTFTGDKTFHKVMAH